MTPALRLGGGADRVLPRGTGAALSIGFVAATFAFFAAVVLALGLAAGRLASDWSSPAAAVATLHVIAPADAVEAQARAALAVLRTTPGVRSVRIVEVEEQRALLAPWFGTDVAIDALPLPLLIEVATDAATLDREALGLRLAAEAPGAVYDDHAAWRTPLIVGAEGLRAFAFASLALMALALAAVLGLAAAAEITANAATIETLRLIGARDSFIIAALTRRVTLDVAAGAVIGAALGLLLVATLSPVGEAGFFLVGIGLTGWGWLAPVTVPPACAAIAWTAARLAAGANLRRWS